jgi:hypothetical protein
MAVMALSSLAISQSQQSQPLGDYARAAKKAKPATVKSARTYDNDNMPRTTKLSVVGPEQPALAANDNKDQTMNSATKESTEQKSTDQKAEETPQVKAGQSTEDRERAVGDWKQKIDEQKGKVDLLQRELDVLQRERQIKQADFYSSTARAVQNARGFDDEDAKYKQQMADKQKSLDDAKAKLNDVQEQARKSGVPSSGRE